MQNTVPFDEADFVNLNKRLRHRLRNLLGGMGFVVQRLRGRASSDGLEDYLTLVEAELGRIQHFTMRMDLLAAPLVPPLALTLAECRESLQMTFAENHPGRRLEWCGPETGPCLVHGAWLVLVLGELADNAAEATPFNCPITIVCEAQPWRFSISNPVDDFPVEMALEPPRPFAHARRCHDGMGLAIAHRYATAAGTVLRIHREDDQITASVEGALTAEGVHP